MKKIRFFFLLFLTTVILGKKTSEVFAFSVRNMSNLFKNARPQNQSLFSNGISTGFTSLISRSSEGTLANNSSYWPTISEDGRFIAFMSGANNLVEGDTQICYVNYLNTCTDIFIYDRINHQTIIASKSSASINGNGNSNYPSISGDGRFIAFVSESDNLVNNDTNGFADIFVHDVMTNQTTRVSVASDGTQANGASDDPSISSDGRYIAFLSYSSNLVNNNTNGTYNVFLHDMQTHETTLISIRDDGAGMSGDMPTISSTGNFVVYRSQYPFGYLQSIYLHNTQTGETIRVSKSYTGGVPNGDSAWPSISANGDYVAYVSSASDIVDWDTNGYKDVFVYDKSRDETYLITIGYDGSTSNGDSYSAAISSDGTSIALYSVANNLVPNEKNNREDIFVVDGTTGFTQIASIASDGTLGNGHSYALPSISGSGRYVAFMSEASNLVSGDSNGFVDIFVRDTIIFNAFLPLITR